MLIVSACLAGLKTRHDGTDCVDKYIQSLVIEGKALPLCPEQLGGLSTPREPIEIVGGDGDALINGKARAIGVTSGKDYTQHLLRGANEVLKITTLLKPEKAIFKDGSPSCGSSHIKSANQKIKGRGVTTAVLLRTGVKVQSN